MNQSTKLDFSDIFDDLKWNIDPKLAQKVRNMGSGRGKVALSFSDYHNDPLELPLVGTFVANGKSALIAHDTLPVAHNQSETAIDEYLSTKSIHREDILIWAIYDNNQDTEDNDLELSLTANDASDLILGLVGVTKTKALSILKADTLGATEIERIKAMIDDEVQIIQNTQNGAIFDMALIDDDGEVIEIKKSVAVDGNDGFNKLLASFFNS